MLVNLYKTKTPLAVFSFPFVIAIIALSLFYSEPSIQPTFFAWQYELEKSVFARPLMHYGLTVFIVYLAAVALNRLVNVFGFFSKNTYLPGLIFAISIVGFGAFNFSMDLIAYTLIIWGMGYLFRINRQDPALSYVFMAAFFFGCATVFEPMLAPILLLPWLGLAVFRSFIWREYLLSLIGGGLPWLYFGSTYFMLTGKLAPTPEIQEAAIHDVFFTSSMIILLCFLIILFLYSIWRYVIVLNTQLLVIKKRSRLLFHMTWMSVVSLILGWWVKDNIVLMLNIPFSIIIAVQLLNDRNATVGNIILFAWLGISAWVLFF